MWNDKIKIEKCPFCYENIRCEYKEDNFDKNIECGYCKRTFIVSKNIINKIVEPNNNILYCPVCTCTNSQWVRQKNMPYKCKHEICKFEGVIKEIFKG